MTSVKMENIAAEASPGLKMWGRQQVESLIWRRNPSGVQGPLVVGQAP